MIMIMLSPTSVLSTHTQTGAILQAQQCITNASTFAATNILFMLYSQRSFLQHRCSATTLVTNTPQMQRMYLLCGFKIEVSHTVKVTSSIPLF